MKLSHSKLQLLLKDPMSYHLKYDLGISQIETKAALRIGSAVHWGLEHSTDCLDEFYGNVDNYSDEQGLAEAMVSAYLRNKDEIFDLILTGLDDKGYAKRLKLVNEQHELFINAKLPSLVHPKVDHDFIGIADLLLETDEGLVLIDYKTSSTEPSWDGYLEQIYRYIFMLKTMYPDKPVCKIGIINLRKSKMRQKTKETTEMFYKRMKDEYAANPWDYLYVHMYKPEDLNQELLNAYIKNLSKMADTAEMIDKNQMFYINFGAQNDYGKSEYYDIFYHTPGAFCLYNITDTILDDSNCIKFESNGGRRPCTELDIEAIDNPNIINKYSRFRDIAMTKIAEIESFDKDQIIAQLLSDGYLFDQHTVDMYWSILMKEIDE